MRSACTQRGDGKGLAIGNGGGSRPEHGDEAGERPQARDAEGMDRKHGDESGKDEQRDDSERDIRREAEREQIEQDDVPDRREADEITFLSLALKIGDVEQARQQDGRGGGQPRWLRQKLSPRSARKRARRHK